MTADEAARFRPGEAAAHANNVNPKLTPNNPAFHGEGRYGAPPNPTTAASAAPAAPAQGGVRGAMRGAKEFALGAGETTKSVGGTFKSVGGGLKAAGATGIGLAKTALTSPIAAGAAGGMAAYDGSNTDTEAYAKRFGMESTEPGVGRDLGLRTLGVASDLGNNLLLGLPGKYLFRDKQDQGAEGTPNGAPTASTQNTLSNPYANATPEQGRAMAEVNRTAAQPAAPGGGGGPADSGGIRRIDRPGQSPLFTNMPDGGLLGNDNLMARGSGPNAQNMAAADALAGRQQQESMARLGLRGGAGGGGGGPGSGPVEPGSFTGGFSGVIGPTDTYGNMRGRTPEQQRRDAEVSAGSIHGPTAAIGKAKLAALDAMQSDATKAGAERYKADSTLRGNIYQADNSLRGTVYSADSSRAGQMATARSKQQELAYTRQRDALKDAMDIERHAQTVGHNADSNARNDTRVFGPDGKVNEGMSAARYDVANQLFPGYGQMDEASRKAVNPDVKEMLGIFDRTYENKQMGLSKLNPLDPRDPKRSAMPNFQGGTLKKQGPEGYITPGGEMGGYYVTDAEGNDIPLGKLNERQIELIKRQIRTGSWTDKKEGK